MGTRTMWDWIQGKGAIDALAVDVTVSLQGVLRHFTELEKAETQAEANEIMHRTTFALDTVCNLEYARVSMI